MNVGNIVTIEGNITPIEPKNGEDFKLKELQEVVNGYIEIVHLDPDTFMVVNEDGKSREDVNMIATMIAFQKKAIRSGDYICGNVLICPEYMVK